LTIATEGGRRRDLGELTMRVVAALGGNALLRRGEPMTAENQRANVACACGALDPLAREHELVISHGNGPQVGLLALHGAAYTEVETYPLDVLDAQTEGVIGYVIMQELGNLRPLGKPLTTVLTLIEVGPSDPAFANPTKPIGPIYTAEEAAKLAADKGWAFKPDGEHMRRVVASPLPKHVFGIDPIRWLLEHGSVVICTGGGGISTIHTNEPVPAGRRLSGVEAVRQGPRKRRARRRPSRRRAADRHRCGRGLCRLGETRSSEPSPTRRRPSSLPPSSPRAQWLRRSEQRANTSNRPPDSKRSAPSTTPQDSSSTAGTRVIPIDRGDSAMSKAAKATGAAWLWFVGSKFALHRMTHPL
jgi:hypothetical protein